MKRNLKERFEDRSFLFLMTMIIGLNMFVLTLGSVIYLFLINFILVASILTVIAILLFIGPYLLTYYYKGEIRRLSDTLLDNVFLAGFSISSTVVGISILILNQVLDLPTF